MLQKKLPVGIEDFAELRENDFYYVDKTGLIKDILDNWCKVTLFTRPRRFGKTLNMSMLRYFFEIGTDPALFENLTITKESDLCHAYMGQYPVIFISLKNVDGMTFEDARIQMWEIIKKEARRVSRSFDIDRLNEEDTVDLQNLKNGIGNIDRGLELLSGILTRYYGKKAIILIDEYDVPLDKAYYHGYYDQMVLLVRQIFGYALKTNENLQFAVLTGCLRVSKESIFTGLNNMKVLSIIDERYDEWFGFTDVEVREMLAFYEKNDHYDTTREWYDGYRFGTTDVYCPWDVINWCDLLCHTTDPMPQDFWINTSGNELVQRFVYRANSNTSSEIEQLIAGEAISKHLRLDLTYDELDRNIDNLWSVLFTTGYLTQDGMNTDGSYRLKIPNHEVHDVFTLKIRECFNEKVRTDSKRLDQLFQSLRYGDTAAIEAALKFYLAASISIQDAKAPKGKKENFYHGLLLGMLSNSDDLIIKSNAEAGEGFADICAYCIADDYGFVIEIKYADNQETLDAYAQKALVQIQERHYEEYLLNEGIEHIHVYGISFFKKRCKVVGAKIK